MKAKVKKVLQVAGTVLFVVAFTLTNKDGNTDGWNLAAFVSGVFCILYSETSEENQNNNA